MYSQKLQSIKVNNFVFFLLIYVSTNENNFSILVNDSFGETDSNLFSAEVIFQKNPCSQEPPYGTWNADPLPRPQKHMKHTEQGLSEVTVIALHSWKSLNQQTK